MSDGFRMIALIIPDSDQCILSVSENGYGKRTRSDEFPVYGRGGQGVIAMQASDRNGPIVGAAQVADGDEIMLISIKVRWCARGLMKFRFREEILKGCV